MQSYLAWSNAVTGWVDSLDASPRDKLRAKLVAGLVTDALAPTNAVLTNPAAMKATLEQGGKNLVAGLQHFIGRHDRRTAACRRWSTSRSSRVGENLAVSPGKVVYAEDHLELIQYAPQTDEVWSRPVFIVPPQINKFYIWDLAPGRSIVEYLVAQGHQVFLVSWRNPSEAQADWDLASYVEALDRATAVACEISGVARPQRRRRLLGRHHRGAAAGALGRTRRRAGRLACRSSWRSSTSPARKDTSMGLFANFETLELARMFSRSKGVLEGKDLERAFAWLRPNDLIWAYWVNNYLMGKEPPAFDILYWNADTTNLPAALHADLLGLIETGGITAESGPTIGGHALKLAAHHLRHLPDGRRDRPHHALGRLLPDPRRARRQVDLRAQPVRPHPVADQPAGQPEGAVPDQRRRARHAGGVPRRRRDPHRQLVAALARLARRPRRRARSPRRRPRARAGASRSATRPAPTCGAAA